MYVSRETFMFILLIQCIYKKNTIYIQKNIYIVFFLLYNCIEEDQTAGESRYRNHELE